MSDEEKGSRTPGRSGRTLLGKGYEAFGAGAVGGVIQSMMLWFFIQTGSPFLLGLVLAQPLTSSWLYQRAFWGGLWGLFFLLPLWTGTPQWKRGLVLGLIPATASLFYFLPFQDNHGLLGLKLGWGMPVLVIGFGLLWGVLAGYCYGKAFSRNGDQGE